MKLYLDFETRSMTTPQDCGAYAYAHHPSTSILCTGFGRSHSTNGLPGIVSGFNLRPGDKIVAHNAAFERYFVDKYFAEKPSLDQWVCTAAKAAAAGIPRSLDGACKALGLSVQKDMEGYNLMLKTCRADRPMQPGELDRLIEYCVHDVNAEIALDEALPDLTDYQRRVWLVDQVINDRGFCVDRDTCRRLLDVVSAAEGSIEKELRALTGLTPWQLVALKEWLEMNGLPLKDLTGPTVASALASGKLTPLLEKVLLLRQEGGKSSTSKLHKFMSFSAVDGRARDTLMYYGASTGRWSGRGIQPQNFPRGQKLPKGQTAEGKLFALLFGIESDAMGVASSALRSLVVAGPGKKLMACDYSNIEGRIAAWMADETWKVAAFEAFDAGSGPDLYRLAYAKAFRKDVDSVTDAERTLGKVMELALQYQGWVGAFADMGLTYGVTVGEKKAEELCAAWRSAHPMITQAWKSVDAACVSAVQTGRVYPVLNSCRVGVRKDCLLLKLPSGRCVKYYQPELCVGKYGAPAVSVMTQNSETKKWERQQMYGGCWFENAVQACAADVMSDALLRLERQGFSVVLHVHDEVIVEESMGVKFSEFRNLMAVQPEWAAGLPIAAAGWEGRRYRKG